MKSKLEIYALVVCFTSIVALVISFATFSYAVLEISIPKITMSSYTYNNYQSNEAYWNILSRSEKTRPSEEILTKKRVEQFEIAIEGERRDGFRTALQSLVYIFPSLIVLFIHWRLAKRSRG